MMDTYKAAMSDYRRLFVQRKYEQALRKLDEAICVCPIDEALPELHRLRSDLAPKAEPFSLFGLFRARARA